MKSKINIPIFILNVLICATFISLALLFDPRPDFIRDNQETSSQYILLKTVLLMLMGFYLNMYLLVPKVLTRKGWPTYLMVVIAILLIFILLFRITSFYPTLTSGRPTAPPVFIFLLILAFSLSTTFRLVNDRKQDEQRRKEKEFESLSTQLSLLRSQISPHFLFNVLNTLSSLARQKSENLEAVIINVSQLMRYMLYNKPEKRISLQNEMEYLISYIELQQLRFGKDLMITKNIAIENPDKEIEPMILIPFVENAFKHGIGTVANPMIELTLTVTNNNLQYVVKNQFNPDVLSTDDASGIGLQNVKKRLSLLYKDRHELKIAHGKNCFVVNLTILL